jgi:hypothetical protein
VTNHPIVLLCCLLLGAFLPAAGLAESKSHAQSLNILVYGASGKIGVHIVDEALARGHQVTGVSRDPGQITRKHERFTVVQGDLLDVENVQAAIQDRDVIILSVRGVIGPSENPADTIARIGAQNLVDALRRSGQNRSYLIHVGGAATLEISPGVLLADRVPKLFLKRDFELEIAGQIQALEFLRGVDDVAWTYATPPRTFTNGKRRGVFRIGGDRLMEDSRGKSMISRSDFAVAVMDEAETREHQGQRFSVAY